MSRRRVTIAQWHQSIWPRTTCYRGTPTSTSPFLVAPTSLVTTSPPASSKCSSKWTRWCTSSRIRWWDLELRLQTSRMSSVSSSIQLTGMLMEMVARITTSILMGRGRIRTWCTVTRLGTQIQCTTRHQHRSTKTATCSRSRIKTSWTWVTVATTSLCKTTSWTHLAVLSCSVKRERSLASDQDPKTVKTISLKT